MIGIILGLGAAYVAIGVLFAVLLHARGLRKIDPGVEGGGVVFRLLITPGLVTLWPVLAIKWRNASRGLDVAGEAEAPVSARGLRVAHRALVSLLAVLLPLAVGAGWAARPGPLPVEESLLGDTLLGKVGEPSGQQTLAEAGAFGELPIALVVRSQVLPEGENQRQIELSIAEDLEAPALALFWAPTADGQALPPKAVYLGPVWGPAVLHYDLPEPKGGHLVLYSLAHQTRWASQAL